MSSMLAKLVAMVDPALIDDLVALLMQGGAAAVDVEDGEPCCDSCAAGGECEGAGLTEALRPRPWANAAARYVTRQHTDGWSDLTDAARLQRWVEGLTAFAGIRTIDGDVSAARDWMRAHGFDIGADALAILEGRGEPCKRGERADATGCIPKKPGSSKRRGQQGARQGAVVDDADAAGATPAKIDGRRGSIITGPDGKTQAVALTLRAPRGSSTTAEDRDAARGLRDDTITALLATGDPADVRRANILGQVSNGDWWADQTGTEDLGAVADTIRRDPTAFAAIQGYRVDTAADRQAVAEDAIADIAQSMAQAAASGDTAAVAALEDVGKAADEMHANAAGEQGLEHAGQACAAGERSDLTGCTPSAEHLAGDTATPDVASVAPVLAEADVPPVAAALSEIANTAATGALTPEQQAAGEQLSQDMAPLADAIQASGDLAPITQTEVERIQAAMDRLDELTFPDGKALDLDDPAELQRYYGYLGARGVDERALDAAVKAEAAARKAGASAALARAVGFAVANGAKTAAGVAINAARYVAELGFDGVSALMQSVPRLAVGLLQLAAWPLTLPHFAATAGTVGAAYGMYAASLAGVTSIHLMAASGLVPLIGLGMVPIAVRKLWSMHVEQGDTEPPVWSLLVSQSGLKNVAKGLDILRNAWSIERESDVFVRRPHRADPVMTPQRESATWPVLGTVYQRTDYPPATDAAAAAPTVPPTTRTTEGRRRPRRRKTRRPQCCA